MPRTKKKKKTTKKKVVKKRKSKRIKKTKKVKKKAPSKKERYFRAIGRRKTATARVRLFPKGKGEILINDKALDVYFPNSFLQGVVRAPLEIAKSLNKFKITAIVKGGGKNAQAEALRHGIARALVDFNAKLKKELKKAGFLKRDPRMRERKKFGLKRARRGPQWAKR
jgi:small subunit ribosomal protein S9